MKKVILFFFALSGLILSTNCVAMEELVQETAALTLTEDDASSSKTPATVVLVCCGKEYATDLIKKHLASPAGKYLTYPCGCGLPLAWIVKKGLMPRDDFKRHLDKFTRLHCQSESVLNAKDINLLARMIGTFQVKDKYVEIFLDHLPHQPAHRNVDELRAVNKIWSNKRLSSRIRTKAETWLLKHYWSPDQPLTKTITRGKESEESSACAAVLEELPPRLETAQQHDGALDGLLIRTTLEHLRALWLLERHMGTNKDHILAPTVQATLEEFVESPNFSIHTRQAALHLLSLQLQRLDDYHLPEKVLSALEAGLPDGKNPTAEKSWRILDEDFFPALFAHAQHDSSYHFPEPLIAHAKNALRTRNKRPSRCINALQFLVLHMQRHPSSYPGHEVVRSVVECQEQEFFADHPQKHGAAGLMEAFLRLAREIQDALGYQRV